MKIKNPKLWHKMPGGIIEGENVLYSRKYLKDVENLYKSKEISNEGKNTLMYEVYSYSEGDETQYGNLFWGLTILHPVYIEKECNMTKGHFHENRNCVEYYFGLEGEGLLLLMDEMGQMSAEKVLPGSLHYIAGNFAHRLVNIGEIPLKIGACWPTTAGHDYRAVEEMPFPYRIYKNNGKIELVER
ncbi:glucose-6-phosphate isomerase [Alkalibaculum bacchi]|uniref:glucose-6-phosphate isomerase n=1 Tax=Alkalibaculum bacchi TaxID=645887 RepID=A0A366I5J1_9FIRM|nr:glucose-6-phosphate isomerase [Alkalibaculum bacchi]